MTRNLCVATVQFQHQAGNKDHNLSRIEHFARQAATSGAQLVCMPEMCISGYWHVPFLDEAGLHAIAEPVDGPSVLRVASLAQHLNLAIGVGWLELGEDERLYNAYRVAEGRMLAFTLSERVLMVPAKLPFSSRVKVPI
ncbi:putative amidohydrolase [Sphingomonas kyeonggiensis]|uniref:Putative amidohydrolase n=1 Tax=Sphingomonas kyeonggiensis TaxID=1268553 RepID=A0A7W6NXN4_9SPHN|nr:putative amidohydrolase [Sphingomonas kyeonggiensis]